jgi:hypothetical protein
MIPFDQFVHGCEGAARSQLRDRPHLLLWTELDDDDSAERAPSPFLTGPLRTGRAPQQVQRPIAALPVQKREGSNGFTMMVTIGRAPNNDIILADRRVSKFHAFLRDVGSSWTLSDANSTNGTRVDEVPVPSERSVRLRWGSRIVLGASIELVFLELADLLERIDGGRA